MAPLAKPAMNAAENGKTKFVPERFDKIYFHWLENIKVGAFPVSSGGVTGPYLHSTVMTVAKWLFQGEFGNLSKVWQNR